MNALLLFLAGVAADEAFYCAAAGLWVWVAVLAAIAAVNVIMSQR